MSAGIRDRLNKLSIAKGDILVTSDPWIRDTLVKMRPPEGIDFTVPVLFAKDVSKLTTVKREQLEEALKLLDDNAQQPSQ